MSEKRNTKLETSDWIAAIAIIVSVVSIIITLGINNITNDLTEKVNSKEFQMSENLKYEITEMITLLRSIDNKAKLYRRASEDGRPLELEEVDFSYELQSLRGMQLKPSYLIFLSSIDNEFVKNKVEEEIRLLTDYYLVSKTTTMTEVRIVVKDILNKISEHVDVKNIRTLELEDWLQILCGKALENTATEKDYFVEMSSRGNEFLSYLLEKHDDDYDVLYYYYLFYLHEPDTANMCVELGATPIDLESNDNIGYWEWYLWSSLEKKYMEEYSAFCKNR